MRLLSVMRHLSLTRAKGLEELTNRESGTYEIREFCQRRDLKIRQSWQAFRALAITVAPDDAHTAQRGSMCVPGIGRLKSNFASFNSLMIDGVLVDLWMRLVHTDGFNG